MFSKAAFRFEIMSSQLPRSLLSSLPFFKSLNVFVFSNICEHSVWSLMNRCVFCEQIRVCKDVHTSAWPVLSLSGTVHLFLSPTAVVIPQSAWRNVGRPSRLPEGALPHEELGVSSAPACVWRWASESLAPDLRAYRRSKLCKHYSKPT